MELTKAYLKQLIKEEREKMMSPEGDAAAPQEENPSVQGLKQKLLDLTKNLAGIQTNEVDMINLFIELIDLAKRENINSQELRRKLGFVKQVAQKISK